MPITKANVNQKQMEKIHDALSAVIGGHLTGDVKGKISEEQLIANRKYVLAQIVEMYCSWKGKLDCLPSLIQVGAFNPTFLRIVETDVYGNIKPE